MIARVSHDHIEVMETRRIARKYMEFYEDINDIIYTLIDKNMIHYPLLKESPNIKPLIYQAYLFL